MDVRLPDGTIIQNVPDGTTKADLVAKLQRNGMNVPAEWLGDKPAPAAAESVVGALRDIPRQVGLGARYLLEGAPAVADTLASPFRAAQEIITGKRVKTASGEGGLASQLADWIGLPTPQTANERVVGDASRLVASSLGFAGGSQALSKASASEPAKAVLQSLAANPGQQAISAAGSGLAGGAVREAGGSPLEQAAASLLGGVAAPAASAGITSVAKSGANKVRQMVAPPKMEAVDQQIELVLKGSGIDWTQMPERIKQGMRAEVQQAIQTGQPLNADAVRRLVDFKAVGVTPTRGMLTQDPVQITRERNLAKTGANSTDIGLQRLPALESANTQQLLNVLDDAGAKGAPDAYATGQRALDALGSLAASKKAEIDGLYGAARDTAGRSAPLDPHAFTSRANQMLDDALLGSKLPPDVANVMNWIASGQKPVGMHGSVPMPFNVDIAEQLKTRMGDLQRSAQDGQVRKALSIVRQALDDTPLMPAQQVNPGNLPAVPGTVPPSPSALGQQSIDAFNKARAANRQWMQQVEATPALQAALDGVAPDQFVKRFIIGQGASANDVRALRQAVSADPAALQAVKQNIVAHLRAAATNGTEDVTKFSSAAYGKALDGIGERKLAAFFSPDEIAQLQSVKRVGTLMQSQPAGAAVNNSNSGALLLGRGLDVLDQIAGKLPMGLDTTIQGLLRGTQQRQALNVPAGLLSPVLTEPLSRRVLMPAAIGGLLAAQPAN